MLYDVIVTRPFDKVFTYSSINKSLEIGQVVLVPFGKKLETGIIWKKNLSKPKHQIKDITKVIEEIILSHNSIKFINWIANYTLAPLGSVLKLFLINNDIVDYETKKISENKISPSIISLNKEQEIAKLQIIKSFKKSNKPILLEGVTGSGKTECFMLPILAHLHRSAKRTKSDVAKHAVRCLVLYPMNALVADQLGRLRDMLGDRNLSQRISDLGFGRYPRIGMYTSRAPFHGWYAKLGNNEKWDTGKNRQSLRDIQKTYQYLETKRPEVWRQMLEKGKIPAKGFRMKPVSEETEGSVQWGNQLTNQQRFHL